MRKRIQVETSYSTITLDSKYQETQKQLRWLRLLRKNRRQLEQIASIVCLDSLWDYTSSFAPMRTLPLLYRGKAKSHTEATDDLVEIQGALGVIFEDLKPERSVEGHQPKGVYQGDGHLGGVPICVVLRVPWLPEGCKVQVDNPYRTWHRQMDPIRYSVYCER